MSCRHTDTWSGDVNPSRGKSRRENKPNKPKQQQHRRQRPQQWLARHRRLLGFFLSSPLNEALTAASPSTLFFFSLYSFFTHKTAHALMVLFNVTMGGKELVLKPLSFWKWAFDAWGSGLSSSFALAFFTFHH